MVGYRRHALPSLPPSHYIPPEATNTSITVRPHPAHLRRRHAPGRGRPFHQPQLRAQPGAGDGERERVSHQAPSSIVPCLPIHHHIICVWIVPASARYGVEARLVGILSSMGERDERRMRSPIVQGQLLARVDAPAAREGQMGQKPPPSDLFVCLHICICVLWEGIWCPVRVPTKRREKP